MYGIIEDNLIFLLNSTYKLDLSNYSESLFIGIFQFFSSIVDSIFLYHVFLVVLVVVNFSAFYRLFSSFIKNNKVGIVLSLTAIFSPYLLYKSQNHLFLMNVWILPVFILLCYRLTLLDAKLRHFFWFGLLFGVTSLFSNYLGFFGLLFSGIYLGLYMLFDLFKNNFPKKLIIKYLLRFTVLYLSVIFPILTLNFRYLEANFINPTESNENFTLARPIDDFFIFSSRPWYYFLPSVDNPFYGSISKSILNYLEVGWGSYLAQNYFKSEHSSSYLGIVNFILAFLGVVYVYKNRAQIKNYPQLVVLGISGLSLVLFTMPPYLEFSSWRFYFPSYLVFDFFPMFRVLSRLGIFVLLITLVFTGYGYLQLKEWLQKLKLPIFYFYSALGVLLVASLSEFFIPFKFTDIRQMPEVYEFLGENTSDNEKLVIFPRGKSLEGYFWSKDHRREVFIPERDHLIGQKIVSKDDFYNNVAFTCEGLKALRGYGADYFIYFFNADQNSEAKITFLAKNLDMVREFNKIEKTDSYENPFIRVANAGNTYSNQSILFKFRETESCSDF